MKISFFRYLYLSIFLMLLDVSSKCWIRNNFYIGESLYILPGLNIYPVYNIGLAFGLFSNINLHYRWFLVWVILLIILVFIIMLYRSTSVFYSMFFAVILGGALGNFFDRIWYGVVLDFIDIHIGNFHWPIFNIADIEILIGIIVLMLKKI